MVGHAPAIRFPFARPRKFRAAETPSPSGSADGRRGRRGSLAVGEVAEALAHGLLGGAVFGAD